MIRLALSVVGVFLAAGAAMAAKSLPLELHDGVTLEATYFAADRPGPGLLFLNMCDPSRDQREWQFVATALADKGYHILTFDYRGFGQSGGEMPMNLRTSAATRVAIPRSQRSNICASSALCGRRPGWR